jgi:hypothetical protein
VLPVARVHFRLLRWRKHPAVMQLARLPAKLSRRASTGGPKIPARPGNSLNEGSAKVRLEVIPPIEAGPPTKWQQLDDTRSQTPGRSQTERPLPPMNRGRPHSKSTRGVQPYLPTASYDVRHLDSDRAVAEAPGCGAGLRCKLRHCSTSEEELDPDLSRRSPAAGCLTMSIAATAIAVVLASRLLSGQPRPELAPLGRLPWWAWAGARWGRPTSRRPSC